MRCDTAKSPSTPSTRAKILAKYFPLDMQISAESLLSHRIGKWKVPQQQPRVNLSSLELTEIIHMEGGILYYTGQGYR